MSADIVKAGGIAVLCLGALLCVRQVRENYLPLLRIASVVLFFGIMVGIMSPMLDFIGDTLDKSYKTAVLKALGVAFLTGICSQVCRESGEDGLALGIENVGKTEILLLALPFLRDVLSASEEMLTWQ